MNRDELRNIISTTLPKKEVDRYLYSITRGLSHMLNKDKEVCSLIYEDGEIYELHSYKPEVDDLNYISTDPLLQ